MAARFLYFAVSLAVFLLDQFAKRIIRVYVPEWEMHAVIPGFFNLVHTENRGGAFGVLSEADPIWRNVLLIGLSAVVLIFIARLLWHPSKHGLGGGKRLPFALSLALGGALGNLYDRLAYGSVTDFVELYIGQFRWPAFNVADSALTIGATLMILDLWMSRKKMESA